MNAKNQIHIGELKKILGDSLDWTQGDLLAADASGDDTTTLDKSTLLARSKSLYEGLRILRNIEYEDAKVDPKEITLAFCRGILSIIEISPSNFNIEGVKEAIKRIDEASSNS